MTVHRNHVMGDVPGGDAAVEHAPAGRLAHLHPAVAHLHPAVTQPRPAVTQPRLTVSHRGG